MCPFSIAVSDCGVVVAADCILLGVGYQGGVVKVYSLTTCVHWTNQFTIVASLATELHRESGGCGMEWVWSAHKCVHIYVCRYDHWFADGGTY